MSSPAFAFPDHAYLPGLTARHDEALFAAVKAAAPVPTRSEAAEDNLAWRHGLDLFAAGYFWEAHEVLEAVWMNAAPNSAEKHVVQGVIQLANAALKCRMGRANAATRLTALARDAFARVPEERVVMGLSVARLRAAAAEADLADWPHQAAALEAADMMQHNAQLPEYFRN